MILVKNGWDWAGTAQHLALRSPLGSSDANIALLLTAGGRDGRGAIALGVWAPDPEANSSYIVIPGDGTTRAFGVACMRDTAQTTDKWGIFKLRAPGGGWICTLLRRTDGRLELLRGNESGPSLDISTDTFFDDTSWHHVGMEIVVHSSSGSLRVIVDNAEILNLSGINTEGAAGGIRRCYLNGVHHAAQLRRVRFDDFYADSAVYRGDLAISSFMADADGHVTDWTRNTGAADWQAVDEPNANDDTDYLRSTAIGTRSAVGVTPGIGAGLSIVSASAIGVGRSEAGGGDGFKFSILSGLTELQSAKIVPQATYAGMAGPETEVDPDTGVAWTPGGLDAVEVVVEHA